MLEKQFQKRVKDFLDILPNSWFFQTVERSQRGIPDIVGHINGHFFALELKRSIKTKSGSRKLQEYNIAKIDRTGAYGMVVAPENWDLVQSVLIVFSRGRNVSKSVVDKGFRGAS